MLWLLWTVLKSSELDPGQGTAVKLQWGMWQLLLRVPVVTSSKVTPKKLEQFGSLWKTVPPTAPSLLPTTTQKKSNILLVLLPSKKS